MLQSITECNRVLKSVTVCYRLLKSVKEYYRVLQNVAKCNRVLQIITEYHRVFTVAARQQKAAHTGGSLPKLGRGPPAVKKAISPEQNHLCKEKVSRLGF